MSRSLIECRELPAARATGLKARQQLFRHSTSCPLRQGWLTGEETGFAPATVRTGWRPGWLLVFAELNDEDIFTRATGLNQRLWELGDVFEIFLQPEGQEAYVEFQISPNNCRLQLRYQDAAAIDDARRTGSITNALIPGDAFRSTTWVDRQANRWFIYAGIPSGSVGDKAGPGESYRWRFSFSRYDYTRGRETPVISSTSSHLEPDFHRRLEWGTLHFCR